MNEDIEDDEIYDFSQENPEFPSKPPREKKHRIRGAVETARRWWDDWPRFLWRERRRSRQDMKERKERGGGSR
jgi:hypothetical protein